MESENVENCERPLDKKYFFILLSRNLTPKNNPNNPKHFLTLEGLEEKNSYTMPWGEGGEWAIEPPPPSLLLSTQFIRLT